MDDKLQGLQALLARVTHDLRTPLAVLHTTTTLLLNPKYQLNATQIREQHERMRRNVDLMNRMLGELSDLAQMNAGTFAIDRKPTNIGDVLQEAVTALESAAQEKSVKLSFDSGGETLNAPADRARLLRLFQILLGNALDASNAGQSITVTSRPRDSKAHIEFTDDGAGLANEDLPHVFDPYYPAGSKHQKTGTVLGLCIGKGVVDAHGGEILCRSEPGRGTTFSITLPLAQ